MMLGEIKMTVFNSSASNPSLPIGQPAWFTVEKTDDVLAIDISPSAARTVADTINAEVQRQMQQGFYVRPPLIAFVAQLHSAAELALEVQAGRAPPSPEADQQIRPSAAAVFDLWVGEDGLILIDCTLPMGRAVAGILRQARKALLTQGRLPHRVASAFGTQLANATWVITPPANARPAIPAPSDVLSKHA
jgi:hypothetical protein